MTTIEDARAALAEVKAHHPLSLGLNDRLARLVAASDDLIAEHERLTAPPADDEREALARIMDPTAWQPPIIPETYREVERNESLHRADLAHAAGFRRRGPVLDADEAALRKHLRFKEGMAPDAARGLASRLRAALEAARDAE